MCRLTLGLSCYCSVTLRFFFSNFGVLYHQCTECYKDELGLKERKQMKLCLILISYSNERV